MNKLLHQDISSPEKSASVISEIVEVSKYHLDFLESLKSKMEDKERAASALKSLVEDSQQAMAIMSESSDDTKMALEIQEGFPRLC